MSFIRGRERHSKKTGKIVSLDSIVVAIRFPSLTDVFSYFPFQPSESQITQYFVLIHLICLYVIYLFMYLYIVTKSGQISADVQESFNVESNLISKLN